MLTENEKTEYKKIAAEIHAMSRRLAELADAGFADMEGADMPEFLISERLWCLDGAARLLATEAEEIERLLQPNADVQRRSGEKPASLSVGQPNENQPSPERSL